jgi:hypothetical protein
MTPIITVDLATQLLCGVAPDRPPLSERRRAHSFSLLSGRLGQCAVGAAYRSFP